MHALVAQRKKVLHHLPARQKVIDTDKGTRTQRRRRPTRLVEHQHIGNSFGIELVKHRAVGRVCHCEDQSIHTLLQQALAGSFLCIDLVSRGAHGDHLLVRLRLRIDALQALGENRVIERRQHHSEGARAGSAQVPAHEIGAESQLPGHGQDIRRGCTVNRATGVERSRYGRHRNSSGSSDLPDGRGLRDGAVT